MSISEIVLSIATVIFYIVVGVFLFVLAWTILAFSFGVFYEFTKAWLESTFPDFFWRLRRILKRK